MGETERRGEMDKVGGREGNRGRGAGDSCGGGQGQRNGSRELRDSGRHSRWREERPSAGRG